MSLKKIYLLLAILFTLLVGCKESIVGPLPNHVPELRGFNYTSFTADGFLQGGQHNAIEELKTQIDNNWISLCIFEYQESAFSTNMAPNTTGINPLNDSSWSTTSTEEDIRDGVHQARLHQMNIMLKPQVDVYTNEWRAAIHPDNEGAWFASYTSMMLKYARLAEELHLEMFCIGTEYIVATQHMYIGQWRSLIAAIRRMYTGKLIYAANWSGAYAYGLSRPEFEQVEFWNELDDIGIDAYYPLINSKSDSIPLFETALARAITDVQEIGSLSSLHHRPVIITEIGIQSVKGALATPWDYSLGAVSGAVQDNEVQKFYYRVMIDAIGKQSWCSGIFWWNWESVPTANESTNYTPRNKPAAVTLRQWYSNPAF